MSEKLIVYSASLCSDCIHVKAFLDEVGLEYENRDVAENPAYRNDLEENTGKVAVPYFIVNGEWRIAYEPGKRFSESFIRKQLNGIEVKQKEGAGCLASIK